MEKSGDKVSTFSPFCRKVDQDDGNQFVGAVPRRDQRGLHLIAGGEGLAQAGGQRIGIAVERRLGGRPGHFLPVGVGGQQKGLIGVQADAVFPFDGIVGSERLRFRRQRISHGGFPLIQSARRWSGRGRPAPRPCNGGDVLPRGGEGGRL